jgi:hypothetical protein
MELISYKPYPLSLVWFSYRSWRLKVCNKDRQQSDQGGNGEVLFLFFMWGVAFVAAIVDMIARLPILPLMGRDCQETLCVVR